jgi:hypothetical protein
MRGGHHTNSMRLIAAVWIYGGVAPGAESVAPDPLALSYQQFDQTPGSGWRVLAEQKKYREGAMLIEAYLAKHTEVDRFQRANLHWHAAQLLAMNGDTESALRHFPAARLEPEPPQSPVRWNDYVAATEAFLRGDRAALLAARERIVRSLPDDANLRIVDSLIRHFGKPYVEAYDVK